MPSHRRNGEPDVTITTTRDADFDRLVRVALRQFKAENPDLRFRLDPRAHLQMQYAERVHGPDGTIKLGCVIVLSKTGAPLGEAEILVRPTGG